MYKKLFLNSSVLLILLGCDSGGVFVFEPVDGMKYKEFINMETIIKSARGEATNSSIITLVNDVEVIETSKGANYKAHVKSALQTVNGAKIENPIFNAMVGASITYEVASDGKIIGIKGYDKVAHKASQLMSQEMLDKNQGALSAEALEEQEKKNWSERVESLLGRGAHIGNKWAEVKELTLPTGGVSKYYAAFRIEGDAKCDGSEKCRLISYSFYSDEKDVAEYIDGIMSEDSNEKTQLPSTNDYRVTRVSVSGKGFRIVDPETLVIYKDGAEAIIEMDIDVTGVPLQTIESITKTDYFIEVEH